MPARVLLMGLAMLVAVEQGQAQDLAVGSRVPRWTPQVRPPRGRPKPATTEVAIEAVKVYRVASSRCKSARVLVRQLFGPHLRT